MLAECKLSVQAQTEPHDIYEHLVLVDRERRGCSWAINQLAAFAHGEWLLPLADDDLILPRCLYSLLERSAEGDIIYSPPLVSRNGSQHFFGAPRRSPRSRSSAASCGSSSGATTSRARREEDRKMWKKAMEVGATFVRVDEPLWVYRFHQGNKSYHGGRAS